MNICNQKWDSVTRNGLSPENWKLFGALHQNTRKFINQNFLQFVSLFDHDRNSDRVKRRFDKYLFFLISSLKYYIESLIKIIINKNLFIWKVMFSRNNPNSFSREINRYRRGLKTCPHSKMSKSGHAIFFTFFRRVRATSMTQCRVENTRVHFWTFRLYRFN